MPKNQYRLHRKIFPTSHKILLDRHFCPMMRDLQGDVLVLGAGLASYKKLCPNASKVICTDIVDAQRQLDAIIDAHDLSKYANDSFDAIVAMELFEHLHSPSLACSEAYRVVKPGGRVLLSVPFMFHVHGDPHDYQRFTENGLQGLFSDFSEVRIRPYGSRIHVISDLLTTVAKPFAAFRCVNHVLCLPPVGNLVSMDSPSGYIVDAAK